jgi:hypothetical protein
MLNTRFVTKSDRSHSRSLSRLLNMATDNNRRTHISATPQPGDNSLIQRIIGTTTANNIPFCVIFLKTFFFIYIHDSCVRNPSHHIKPEASCQPSLRSRSAQRRSTVAGRLIHPVGHSVRGPRRRAGLGPEATTTITEKLLCSQLNQYSDGDTVARPIISIQYFRGSPINWSS